MTGPRRLAAARQSASTDTPPGTRRRLSWSDKQAIVAQLRRLGADGRPLPHHVKAVALKWGVSTRAVYQWINTVDPHAPRPERKTKTPVFKPTTDHLVVLAQEQNMSLAHERLLASGLITCSYETFARAIRERTDPTLVAAALDGYPGLVNNRAYLSWTPPHRNHTWHLDHTIMDVWVWPSHKHRMAIKPQVTVYVDGYSSLIHAVPWKTPINGDMVAAGLVEFGIEHDYFGVTVGGQPEQVVCDNAAQHFGPSMRAGVENLGWIMTPTAAYSSWQNGPAERALGLLNQRLANRLPGATKAGTVRNGSSRHVARLPKDIKPHEVLGWSVFTALLQDTVNEINTTILMKKHGRQTRLAAYAADPTEQRLLDPVAYRTALMTSGDMTYMWTKNGLNFDGHYYVGTGLKYGHRYLIRYLPTNRDFIEVFSLDNEWICQALRADRMPKAQVAAFLAERESVERDFEAIQAGVVAHRRQLVAAADAGSTYGVEDTTYDGSEERAAVIRERSAEASGPRDGDAAPTTGSDEDAAPEVAPAKPSRRAGTGRPAAPRVPVRTTAAEDETTRAATIRLASKYGQSLPGTPVKPEPSPTTPTDGDSMASNEKDDQ